MPGLAALAGDAGAVPRREEIAAEVTPAELLQALRHRMRG